MTKRRECSDRPRRRKGPLGQRALNPKQQSELVQLLVTTALPETRAMFAATMLFGMRRSEFTHMRPDWFRNGHEIVVPLTQPCSTECAECLRTATQMNTYWGPNSHPPPETPTWFAKTYHSARRIPAYQIERLVSDQLFDDMTRGAYELLNDYVRSSARKISYQTVAHRVAEWGAKVGRPDLTPHELRATAATNLVALHVHHSEINKLMGWWTASDMMGEYVDAVRSIYR